MVSFQETQIKRIFIIRLAPSEDILESLERFAHDQGIEGAQVSFIGAISHAVLGYFNLESMSYRTFSLDEDLEVTSGIGNISRLEDGTPVIHAHVVVADEKGRSYSGHLMKGCTASVTIEIIVLVFEHQLLRSKDARTDLNLLNLR